MAQEIKTNYISVDGTSALSSYGETFRIGEEVRHQDKEAGLATIERFEPDIFRNEIRVHTNKGYAHLDFLEKIKLEECHK